MFFSKKPKARYISWISQVMKYKGLLARFEQEKNKSTLLLYFFDQTGAEVSKLLTATGLENRFISPETAPTIGFNLISARDLKTMPKVDAVYVLEAHPIHSISRIPLLLAEKQGTKELAYFTAMDEIVMKPFGPERMINLMKKLGLKDDETIEHAMVSASLENAQKKIEEKMGMGVDIRTSPEEWAKVNHLTSLF